MKENLKLDIKKDEFLRKITYIIYFVNFFPKNDLYYNHNK